MSEPDPTPPERPEPVDDLEPVRRDSSFIVRLVLALLVGLVAAAYVGIRLQHAAAGCGGGLIRPGSSVIPPGGR